MLHVTQVLAHDGESTPLAVQYRRDHSFGDLLLESQSQFDAPVLPGAGPVGHGLEPIDDECGRDVERKVTDDVYVGRVVVPVPSSFGREQVLHVESQDVSVEDPHLVVRCVVQQLQNHRPTFV